MALHVDLPFSDSHFAHAFEYANAAARTSASGLGAGDIGKLARQLDDNTLWMVTGVGPLTWTTTGGAGLPAGVEGTFVGTSAPGDLALLWLDTSTSPATLKYHNGAAWVAIQAAGGGAGTAEIHTGTTAPVDTSLFWSDTNTNPAQWKYYNGTSWVMLETEGTLPVGVEGVYSGTGAPGDTDLLWLDTNTTPATLKYHNGTSWVSIQAEADAHTIVSHSDTTATGANLNTLTNGSNADALHAHAGGGSAQIVEGGAAPGDTDLYWVDTNTVPATWKYHNGTSWAMLEGIGSLPTGVEGVYSGSAAPGDTDLLWLDTNTTPATLKYHNGAAWVAVQAEADAHSIVSHSDTTATGANLNTLTDGSNADALHAHAGGAGLAEIDVRPDAMNIDGIATGSDKGTAFSVISCIDFDSSDDGAITFSFKFPSNWNNAADIDLDIQYSCDGSDNGKTVILNTKTWVIDNSTTPVLGTPANDNNDTITTAAGNTNTFTNLTLVNGKVNNTDLGASTNTIVVKMTRVATSDTYTGTFQLIAVIASQA